LDGLGEDIWRNPSQRVHLLTWSGKLISELTITEGRNAHEPVALRRDDLTHLKKFCVAFDLLFDCVTFYPHMVLACRSFRV
jgi:hypothetical protein